MDGQIPALVLFEPDGVGVGAVLHGLAAGANPVCRAEREKPSTTPQTDSEFDNRPGSHRSFPSVHNKYALLEYKLALPEAAQHTDVCHYTKYTHETPSVK